MIGILGAELGGRADADTSNEFNAYVQEVAATSSVARIATPELLPILEQVYLDASKKLATAILQACAIPVEGKASARGNWQIWSGLAAGALILPAAGHRLFKHMRTDR